MTAETFAVFHYKHDGLALAGRLYGDLAEPRLPFVCLPGLTRNGRDFHAFAQAVRSGASPRPVVAFDYRGRGLSDRASSGADYTLPLEMADVVAGLAHLGIGRAVFVGTSRGALMIHLLATAHPRLIAGAVLNDAGPRLELAGLLAIKAYVGKSGVLPDWEAATNAVERINAATFPALKRDDFARMTKANFRETSEGIVADYDPRLAEGLAAIGSNMELPEMWDAFAALSHIPLMIVRGEHSQLLSPRTVERMETIHPMLERLDVAGQGHAPLLETAGLPERIAAFADRLDG